MRKLLFTMLAMVLIPFALHAQQGYSSAKEMGEYLKEIKSKYPNYVNLKSLTKTPNGNDVWAVTLGSGDVANHPAVAVVAGLEPSHLVGVEGAKQLISKILSGSNVASLLEKNTFYIFPLVNPDGTQGYFSKLKEEHPRTFSLYDNDRDGLMSEDGVEDLNGDGVISSMIVESLEGKYIKHPSDDRVIILADASKGEKGVYELYREGVDNDNDGLLNEDGKDGVILNRNFTFKYKNWGAESGNYPVSEAESRALLDFMYDAFNIHSVVTYGVNDNLYEPIKLIARSRKGLPDKKADSAPYEVDNLLAKKVSAIYKENKGANNNLAQKPLDGNFMEWAYYHFGRNSFATTVWSVPEKDERGSAEAAYLKWADKNGLNSVTEWSKFNHPNFEGKNVEIGSLKPFSLYAPPINLVEEMIDAANATTIKIAEMAPHISLEDVEVKKLENNLYRVSANVVNRGEISTASAIGVQSYFLKYVRVELKLDGQEVVSGLRLSTIKKIDAGGVEKVSWLIKGKGSIELEAGAPQAGYVKQKLTL